MYIPYMGEQLKSGEKEWNKEKTYENPNRCMHVWDGNCLVSTPAETQNSKHSAWGKIWKKIKENNFPGENYVKQAAKTVCQG